MNMKPGRKPGVYMTAIYLPSLGAVMHGVDAGGSTVQEESAGAPSRSRDDRLFRNLLERFAVMAETCARFSRDIYNQVGDPPEADMERAIKRNLAIARRVFEGGLLEILAVVYLRKAVGFDDLRRTLGGPPAAGFKKKLESLERSGLVQRDSRLEGTADARYSLTHKGVIIARLGEPVMQYLRMAEGWSKED